MLMVCLINQPDITSNGKTIFLPSEILEKNGITPSTEDNS